MCQKSEPEPTINSLFRLVSLLIIGLQWGLAASSYADQGYATLEVDNGAVIRQLFPKATRIEPKREDFPVYPVYQLQQLLGYAYESNDLNDLPGFAGKPIKLMIGLDTEGRFTGVRVLEHHEPVFLHGLGQQPLFDFIDQYQGHSLTKSFIFGGQSKAHEDNQGPVYIDGVAKATVSVIIINDTILSTALQVARSQLESFALPPAAIPKPDFYQPLTAVELLEQGYLQHWSVEAAAVEQNIGQTLDNYAELYLDADEDAFSNLYLGYLNAPMIGRNLLGDEGYRQLMHSLKQDEQVVAIWSRGAYLHTPDDFKPGSVPNRVALGQGGLAIELRDLNALDDERLLVLEGLPEMEQVHLFRIKGMSGFNPAAETELRLNVELARNHLITDQASLSYPFKLPAEMFDFVEIAPVVVAKDPLWLRIWQDRLPQVAIVSLALILLSWLFVRQRQLTKYGRLFPRLRWLFMAFTLFYIGFYAQGQLSVVNIYTLLLALYQGFDITLFLLDPVIFILWSYTFVSLFLWGRGLYCGWLCPFGALQEILSGLAQKMKLKQWKVPPQWHRRGLWLKYLLLIGLVATAFVSLTLAEQLAEVEPFKTSITLVFVRYWPFVFYALLLLGLGLFIHKFYCRYLCPLGAGLAILGRLRLFSWLDRIELCGSPCQYCKRRCGIDAINRDGSIDYDECIQCLECVVILNDPDQCVASLQQRKLTRNEAHPSSVETLEPVPVKLLDNS